MELLKENGHMILDGGLATELVGDGHLIDNDPLWSARLLKTCPSAIKKVHRDFLDAGSDVIITSSYQASIPSFVKYFGCSKADAEQFISSTVTLAKDARDEFWQKYQDSKPSQDDKSEVKPGSRCYQVIAGSVGPYGACLHDASEYTGTYVDTMSEEDLIEWHRPRLSLLLASHVDVIAVETIPALVLHFADCINNNLLASTYIYESLQRCNNGLDYKKEALAIAKLLKEFPTAKAWLTFSCKDDLHLCHGERFSDAVSSLASYDQVFGVGINCTHPSHVEPLLKSLKEQDIASDKIKVVYPNSGETWEAGKWIKCRDQTMLSEYAASWMNAGATWIGGCCRTTPEDIRKLREVVRSCDVT